GDLVTRGAQVGGRIRPDGVRIEWRTALLAAPLPFLIQDITPRELRVPGGDAAQHPNGFVGVIGVLVTTPDVATAHARFARLRDQLRRLRSDDVHADDPLILAGRNDLRLTLRLAERERAGARPKAESRDFHLGAVLPLRLRLGQAHLRDLRVRVDDVRHDVVV